MIELLVASLVFISVLTGASADPARHLLLDYTTTAIDSV